MQPYSASVRAEVDHPPVQSYPPLGHPIPCDHDRFVPFASNPPIDEVSSCDIGIFAAQQHIAHASTSFTPMHPIHQHMNIGASHDPHMLCSSVGSSTSPAPAVHLGRPPYSHVNDNHFPVYQTDDSRATLKRRNAVTHFGSFHVGSSSSHPWPSNYVHPYQVHESRLTPVMNHFLNDHSNHSCVQEEFVRNVRARFDYSLASEPIPALTFIPSNTQILPNNPYVNSSRASMPSERQHAPVSPIPFVRGVTQDSVVTGNRLESSYFPPQQVVNSNNSIPIVWAPPQGAVPAHNGYTRSNAEMAPCSAPAAPPAVSLRDRSYLVLEGTGSSGQQRSAVSGWRSRRRRSMSNGFHPVQFQAGYSGRWAPERCMTSQQIESRELFDPHWNLRLDIDDMGYEELLALGEQIGNVNTGLPTERISSNMTETTYCSSNQNGTETVEQLCAICLEEYEGGVATGRLKCGHDFHTECIKKWLQMKNACPVCKSSAAGDTADGENQ